jgi:hypothetical protein
MVKTSCTPAADTHMSFYDNVLGPARWSGKPLRFWYALFMSFGNGKSMSCVKAVRMRFGFGPVRIHPLKPANLEGA